VASISFTSASAIVIHWEDCNERPKQKEVTALVSSDVNEVDAAAILLMTFIQEERDDEADEAKKCKRMSTLIDAGARGFLRIVQPPTMTPVFSPATWKSSCWKPSCCKPHCDHGASETETGASEDA
jgi:hypothetical protein